MNRKISAASDVVSNNVFVSSYNKLSITDIPDNEIKGKTFVIRFDYNVPEDYSDLSRITETLETVDYIRSRDGKLVILTHFGRPKGEIKMKFSNEKTAELCEGIFKQKVIFPKLLTNTYEEYLATTVKSAVANMQNRDILLVENTRFTKAEEVNDMGLARLFANLGDIYINDAFGAAHRAHSSTEGVAELLPAYAGLLIKKELENLGKNIDNPTPPFTGIFGGSKVEDKLKTLERLMPKLNNIIIVGAMAYPFLKVNGINIGSSYIQNPEEDFIRAQNIIDECIARNIELLLPIDNRGEDTLEKTDKQPLIFDLRKGAAGIPADMYGLDIGPKSIELFTPYILNSGTIIWNGPAGKNEDPKYFIGSEELCRLLGLATENGAITIVGGGDSGKVIKQAGYKEKVSWVSTGGGAAIELLEGKILPGIAALQDRP